jgi:uroporphyrinogen III methyltransferase/synthase
VARELLPEQLRAQGAEVDVVPVYRTVRPAVATDRLTERLRDRTIDAVTFTSSSTVQNFLALFASPSDARRLLGDVVVACIGPITAATAREAGLSVHVTAVQNTVPALVEALVRHFSSACAGDRTVKAV